MSGADDGRGRGRRLGFTLIFLATLSLLLLLVHVEKDAAGKVRWWIGLGEIMYAEIFLLLTAAELVVGLAAIIHPVPPVFLLGNLLFVAGGVWNIAMGVMAFTDDDVRMRLLSPHTAIILGAIMILYGVLGLREMAALTGASKRREAEDLENKHRLMIKPLVSPEEFVALHKQETALKLAKKRPGDYWKREYERIIASGVKPPPPAPAERKPTDDLRGVQGIGKLTPSQYAMLELAGYNLDPTKYGFDCLKPGKETIPDDDRIAIMKRGRDELMKITGQDFGFDLAAWAEYLEANPEHCFEHHYAAKTTRRMIWRALADPERQRLLREIG